MTHGVKCHCRHIFKRCTCFPASQNRYIVLLCVPTLTPPPHSFFLDHPSANTQSPPLTEKTHSTRLRLSASTAAAPTLFVWLTYHFVTHCAACVHSGYCPSLEWVVFALHTVVCGSVEWTRCMDVSWVFPNQQIKWYWTNSSSHPLITPSCPQGICQVGQIRCFTLKQLINWHHFRWVALLFQEFQKRNL